MKLDEVTKTLVAALLVVPLISCGKNEPPAPATPAPAATPAPVASASEVAPASGIEPASGVEPAK